YGERIGRIDPAGHVTEYPLPRCHGCDGRIEPADITAGPDGTLWFTGFNQDVIGRITTAGHITYYAIPTGCCPHVYAQGITTGPDGALWFTDEIGIGRVTTDGRFAHYGLANPYGDSIVTGPDGALWFTVSYT